MNNKEPLRVFMLEDMKTDQELIKRQVLKFNPNSTFTIASDKASFYEKIEWIQPDLVIADHKLPDFNGLLALFHIKENMPGIPFVFVTGSLNNEEQAAETILSGADGYVLKNNINTLHEKLGDIVKKGAAKRQHVVDLAERKRKHKILMMKMESKLELLADEKSKSELLSILKEMKDNG